MPGGVECVAREDEPGLLGTDTSEEELLIHKMKLREDELHGGNVRVRIRMWLLGAALLFVWGGCTQIRGDVELGLHGDVAPGRLVPGVERIALALVPGTDRVSGVCAPHAVLEPLPRDHDGRLDFECQCRVPEGRGVAMGRKPRNEPLVASSECGAPLREGGPGGVDYAEVRAHVVDERDVAFVEHFFHEGSVAKMARASRLARASPALTSAVLMSREAAI